MPYIPAGITVTSRPVDSLAVSNLLSAYDAGDGYAGAMGRRTLLRLRDALAVRVKANGTGPKLSDLTAKGSALEGFQAQVQRKDRFALLRGKVSSDPAPAALKSRLAELRRTPGLEAVNPAFVDPASGLWLMTSDEIIIALKPGVDGGGRERDPQFGVIGGPLDPEGRASGQRQAQVDLASRDSVGNDQPGSFLDDQHEQLTFHFHAHWPQKVLPHSGSLIRCENGLGPRPRYCSVRPGHKPV